MAQSLVERCREVESYLRQQNHEKRRQAKAIVESPPEEKLVPIIEYLKAELKGHREIRKLWPYLFTIPDSVETQMFCRLYDCSLDELGEVLNLRINQLESTLEVIDEKMERPQSSFWHSLRQEFIEKISREAEEALKF